MKPSGAHEGEISQLEARAGRGLLQRRSFLNYPIRALVGASLADIVDLTGSPRASAESLMVPEWMKVPGAPLQPYGQPSSYEAGVVRVGSAQPTAPGTGSSRTPLQLLRGMITPNGLHFERSHNGVPDINPELHRFVIHGLVKRPLEFTMEALMRYPMVSQIHFVECAGNSAALYAREAVDGTAQSLHGLVSCSEWTGIPLSVLLAEAGVDPRAKWLIAEGGDAAVLGRSVPLAKALDDAMVALYQNGERIRPSNGYPMRLLLPGYEGNMNIKWLRRIKLTEGPAMTKDETSKYSLLLADGSVAQFRFQMDVKSVITRPSPSLTMKGAGYYEISGMAWSGAGRIAKVEVSADGGRSWAEAELPAPILPKAVAAFRIPWRWDGGPILLQSRATDEFGAVQPTRSEMIERRGYNANYHANAISTWGIASDGVVKHAYA